MIYEDLLSLWIAYLLWEFLPALYFKVSPEFKIFLFVGKELFFLLSLLFIFKKPKISNPFKSQVLERIFILLAFLFFSLDITLFNFKAFFSSYYFGDFFIIFWFLHYYFLIKIFFYRLNFEYFRILLGLYFPFFLLILADESFNFFNFHFPGQFLLFLLVILMLSPYFIIKIWPVRRVREGYFRELLDEFFKKVNLKIKDYLVLPKLGAKFYTAGVLGFIPPYRYLFFSEGLLEILSPEEVLGVLAHETGHLKKKHGFFLFLLLLTFPMSLLNFLYFVLLLFSLFFESAEEIAQFLKGPYGVYFDIGLGLTLLFYSLFFFRVIFAYLLRSLEREADLYALALLGDPMPLISSLYKIGEITGQLYRKSWHHYGLWERIQYLRYASEHPEVIHKHSLRLRRIFLLWVLLNLLMLFIFNYLGAGILEKILKIFFP